MKTTRILRPGTTLGILALAAVVLTTTFQPVSIWADFRRYNPGPFDFSDGFYLKNGVDPLQIMQRPGNPDRPASHWALDDSNTDPTRRGVRVTETTGGFDKDGNLIYYSIMGMLTPATFTNDSAGARAKAVAEDFRAFLFPKTTRKPDGSPGSVILSPAPPNRRQDNVFDTKTGYLCDNLLGLWVVTFVVYTQQAFTPAGQAALAPIAATNGLDLDGTPLLKRVDEIEALAAKGYVELRVNPEVGGQGPRWVI
jgi:hypothetical protein